MKYFIKIRENKIREVRAMSISNLQEKMLFFTKQKSQISNNLSNVQMRQLVATRKAGESQMAYNEALQDMYYTLGYGTDEYCQMLLELQSQHEFEMAALTAWESDLEAQKEQYETQLNEVTQYETTWQKLLQNNIKVEFTYGGNGGK